MAIDSTHLPERQERIRKTSWFLKILSLAGCGVMAGCVALTLLAPIIAIGPKYKPALPRSEVRASTETVAKRRMLVELAGNGPRFVLFNWDVAAGGTGIREGREWLARVAAALFCGYGLLGALFFFGLFRGYERGSVFDIQSVRRLRRVGAWMIGTWVMGMAFQLSKGLWAADVNISFDLGAGLLPGVFVFLVAWIMEEAHQIAEEQALTV
ncbi:MAG: DUF2975 domain-containing protein [Verrucomicrobiales bacterium]|nr:DUF2975 domain-containing protein [Verrucomicrobiales bacterium]